MRKKMASSLQPSMRAASESSLGMVKKNWRSKKMLNAPPKTAARPSSASSQERDRGGQGLCPGRYR